MQAGKEGAQADDAQDLRAFAEARAGHSEAAAGARGAEVETEECAGREGF